MGKKVIEKNKIDQKDLPFASMIIQQYKETNKNLNRAVKFFGLIAVILLVCLAVETTYIIIFWDSLHPDAGLLPYVCGK